MKPWYLIQLKPNSHRMAARNLRRQDLKTFLPLHEVIHRKTTHFITDLRPLFPGYMFIGIGKNSPPWGKINSTLGVSSQVNFNGAPRPLPLKLIPSLMLRCDDEDKLLSPATPNPGDRVEVLTGPVSNFIAIIEKIDVKQRIWILMDFMGQSSRLEVSRDQVQFAN
jgi:transcriptional antiterminator RfaH